jgi:hypothetical protein
LNKGVADESRVKIVRERIITNFRGVQQKQSKFIGKNEMVLFAKDIFVL